MATSTAISLAEYLTTSYRPDREFLDGEVVVRNTGKWEHARIQALLMMWLGRHEQEWKIQTATEWRTQVSSTRIRIPDVVVVREESQPDVLVDPPILIVEILSPDDTYSDTRKRAQDYTRMGVSTIWIIDPDTRTARVCSGDTWTQATRLAVSGTPIHVDLAVLFDALDRKHS